MRRYRLSVWMLVVVCGAFAAAKGEENGDSQLVSNTDWLGPSDDHPSNIRLVTDLHLQPTTERIPLQDFEPTPNRESDLTPLINVIWVSICPHFDHRSNDDFDTEFTGGGLDIKTSAMVTDTVAVQFNGDFTFIEQETDYAVQMAIGKLNRLYGTGLIDRIAGGIALEYYSRQPAGLDNWGGQAVGGVRLDEQVEIGAKTGFGFNEEMPAGVDLHAQTCGYVQFSPNDKVAALPYVGVDHDTDTFLGGLTAAYKRSEQIRILMDLVANERSDFGFTMAVIVTPGSRNPLNDGLGGGFHRLVGHGVLQLPPWTHRDGARGL